MYPGSGSVRSKGGVKRRTRPSPRRTRSPRPPSSRARRAPGRPPPRSRPTTGRSNRCGTRCSPRIRAESRHRNRHADTSRRPTLRRSSAAFKVDTCRRHRSAPLVLAATLREPCELPERRVQEPAEPDAFALALRPDPVHSVVPIARAHQRKPWRPTARLRSSARAQCSKSVAVSLGDRRLKVRSCCSSSGAAPRGTGSSRRGSRDRRSLRHSGRRRKASQSRSSEIRVRTPRPDGRMPPMLHVALDELPRRGAENLLARDRLRSATTSAITSWSWSRKP